MVYSLRKMPTSRLCCPAGDLLYTSDRGHGLQLAKKLPTSRFLLSSRGPALHIRPGTWFTACEKCQQAVFVSGHELRKNANKSFLYQGTSLLVPQRAQTESGALALRLLLRCARLFPQPALAGSKETGSTAVLTGHGSQLAEEVGLHQSARSATAVCIRCREARGPRRARCWRDGVGSGTTVEALAFRPVKKGRSL